MTLSEDLTEYVYTDEVCHECVSPDDTPWEYSVFYYEGGYTRCPMCNGTQYKIDWEKSGLVEEE